MSKVLMFMKIKLASSLSLQSSSTTLFIAVTLLVVVVISILSIVAVKAIVVAIFTTLCTGSFIATTVSVSTLREVFTVYLREAMSHYNGFKKLAGSKFT